MATFTNIGLFAGAGGLELGLRIAIDNLETVGYVERDAHAAAVLVARMEDQTLDRAPVWDDITTFDGKPWRGLVDCLSGGFPCQDLSVAGKRAGIDGERSGLWAEFARLIGEIRPRYVFVENVPGLLNNTAMRRVLGDLSALGFDAEWECVRASEVGAPHRRERVFILAQRISDASGNAVRNEPERGQSSTRSPDQRHAQPGDMEQGLVNTNTAIGRQDESERGEEGRTPAGRAGESVEHSDSERLERRCEPETAGARFGLDSCAGAELGDTERGGLQGGRGDGETAEVPGPGCGELADPTARGCGGRRKSSGADGLIDGSDTGLANAASRNAGGQDNELGGASASRRAGEQLADTNERRLESERCCGLLDRERQTFGDDIDRRSFWPPGPNDADGWGEYLAAHPGLEPSVLRGSDGLAYRNERLRLCGNGVVPLQAAAAFTLLYGRLNEQRIEPEKML